MSAEEINDGIDRLMEITPEEIANIRANPERVEMMISLCNLSMAVIATLRGRHPDGDLNYWSQAQESLMAAISD